MVSPYPQPVLHMPTLMVSVSDNARTIFETENKEFLLTGAGTQGWKQP